MIVRLTHNQANSVMLRVDDDIVAAMRSHRTAHGVTQHDYLLPAIGWRRALDAMVAACYGPKGGKLKSKGRPSDSAYLAIARIAKQVAALEAHPALREGAVIGWVPDVIPCWALEDAAGMLYRPYPPTWGGGWEFWLLTPTHMKVHGQKVTVWSRAAAPILGSLQAQGPTYQEDFHLRLSGGTSAG